MYKKGDTGVEPNPKLFELYHKKTVDMLKEHQRHEKMTKRVRRGNSSTPPTGQS